jgi:hypothetical protein
MKKTRVLIGAALAAAALLCAAALGLGGRKPFQNLNAADIVHAAVRLTPPDKTVQILEPTELTKLADYLKDVVIYREDNSFHEYSGQGVTFQLTMADGTQREVMAYNPFLVIDGVGYRTKYEPCQALSQYANDLLSRRDAISLMGKPPALEVVSGNTAHSAILGTYTWSWESSSVIACSFHPLECRKNLQPGLETAEMTAALRFQVEPDEIVSVCRWSDANWGDFYAGEEAVEVDGYEFALKPGGYIYDVQAKWGVGTDFGGIVDYYFYITATE